MKISKSLAIIGVISATLLLSQAQDYNIDAFHTKWFWTRPKEGLYSVNVGLDSSTSNSTTYAGAKIFAIGDLNNDKYNDIITVSEDQTKFDVHYFDIDTYTFTSLNESISVTSNYQITSVFIGKEDSDLLNVYVTIQNDNTKTTLVKNYAQTEVYVFTDSGSDLTILYNSMPYFVDLNGDLKNDILYNSASNEIRVYVGNSTSYSFNSNYVVTDDANCMIPSDSAILSTPHSSAFTDLDGDCMPDLFLTKTLTGGSSIYEIYIQRMINGSQLYCLVQNDTFQSSTTIPLIDFQDIDRDAMTDMIFFQGTTLYTFYNKYAANSASETSLCKSAYDTSVYKDNAIFAKFSDIGVDQTYIDTQTLDSNITTLTSSSYSIPGRIRLGDIDADGYPDIVLTVTKSDSKNYSMILHNTNPADSNTQLASSTSTAVATGRRYFEELTTDYSLTSFSNGASTLAVFFDFDEDGRLDLFMQTISSTGVTDLVCIYNNYVKDTFFIKALMVNSLNAYGDATSGSSYRLIATDLNDNKFVMIGSQLTQSSYNSLQLPYAYIGVGRSNNYIESFTAAYSVGATRAIRVWTPIIPNSQLIVFALEANVNNWYLELFVNPTSSLALIVVACLVCLFIIGLVIIILHIGEKNEDKKNKQKAFDFM